MPIRSITTTAGEVFIGDNWLDSISFRNGSTTGIIYIRNRAINLAAVTSSNYEYSLSPGESVGLTRSQDGDGVVGPFDAISDTAGGVNLEVLPIYRSGRVR